VPSQDPRTGLQWPSSGYC